MAQPEFQRTQCEPKPEWNGKRDPDATEGGTGGGTRSKEQSASRFQWIKSAQAKQFLPPHPIGRWSSANHVCGRGWCLRYRFLRSNACFSASHWFSAALHHL